MALSRLHQQVVLQRLEELYINRQTFFSYRELRHWYRVERIKKLPWEDISKRWAQLLEGENRVHVDPIVAKTDAGAVLFLPDDLEMLSELAA